MREAATLRPDEPSQWHDVSISEERVFGAAPVRADVDVLVIVHQRGLLGRKIQQGESGLVDHRTVERVIPFIAGTLFVEPVRLLVRTFEQVCAVPSIRTQQLANPRQWMRRVCRHGGQPLGHRQVRRVVLHVRDHGDAQLPQVVQAIRIARLGFRFFRAPAAAGRPPRK